MTWEVYCDEIRPQLMLATKGYGLSVDDIDWSCPADMEPYLKTYKLKRNEQDLLQWQLGQYITAAISTIAKGKYPQKPMFQVEEDKKITEEDIQKAILIEQQYIEIAINKGLPETIIE